MFVSQDRDVRAKLNEALNKYGIKQIDVARETGIITIYYLTKLIICY